MGASASGAPGRDGSSFEISGGARARSADFPQSSREISREPRHAVPRPASNRGHRKARPLHPRWMTRLRRLTRWKCKNRNRRGSGRPPHDAGGHSPSAALRDSEHQFQQQLAVIITLRPADAPRSSSEAPVRSEPHCSASCSTTMASTRSSHSRADRYPRPSRWLVAPAAYWWRRSFPT